MLYKEQSKVDGGVGQFVRQRPLTCRMDSHSITWHKWTRPTLP